jgi:hypothetical protein
MFIEHVRVKIQNVKGLSVNNTQLKVKKILGQI